MSDWIVQSNEERDQAALKAAFEHANASLALEGMVLDVFGMRLQRKIIHGELNFESAICALSEHYAARQSASNQAERVRAVTSKSNKS